MPVRRFVSIKTGSEGAAILPGMLRA